MVSINKVFLFVTLSIFYFVFKSYAYNDWADSVINQLSLEEKIAQLMMPAIYPRDTAQVRKILVEIKKYNPGGLIFFQGGPKQVANLVNQIQLNVKVPALLGIDGEWGLSMRLDSVMAYPRQMTLGAISNDSLIFQMGCEIAYQLHRLGLHTNFAPVVDINNNRLNPVIGSRSFGENKYLVANKSLMYMQALQKNKILAVAKHFPGHGDTDVDSHYSLPVIPYTFQRIDSIELYPFKYLIQNNLNAIMTGHLSVPSIDSSGNPASLSQPIIDQVLIKHLGFKGLIFTDALNMKGADRNGKYKKMIMDAFMAKNDILLMPSDLKQAIDTIRNAVVNGIISIDEINYRCRKVLEVKQWLGLQQFSLIDTTKLLDDLCKPEFLLTRQKIYESAITMVTNKNDLLPLKNIDTLRILVLNIGDSIAKSAFYTTSSLYVKVDYAFLHRNSNDSAFYQIYTQLNRYNLVLATLVNTDMRLTRKYGVTDQQIDYLDLVAFACPTVLYVFGSPYIINRFTNPDVFQAVIIGYEDNPLVQHIAAQMTFGAIPIQGKLPVSINNQFKIGHGITFDNPIRVKYTIPEEIKLSSKRLLAIDSIINDGIKQKAMPGCVVYLAKDNKVFYHKAFGYFTYDSLQPVSTESLYDIASVTKIIATTPAIMHLYENDQINLNMPLSHYLKELKKTNKKKLTVIDILTHQAGLNPTIDFYPYVLICKNGNKIYGNNGKNNNKTIQCTTNYRPSLFSHLPSNEFNIPVTNNLYVRNDWRDTLLNLIYKSKILPEKKYKYSDLGFIMLKESIEKISEKPFEILCNELLYKPLGCNTLTFRPLHQFNKSIIAPSEIDTIFRKDTICGTVHDPTAAMLGGIAGHAGLFSTANDLGKVLHMYLNKGSYGGKQYFKTQTIDLFTTSPFKNSGNRRALGFDKPETDSTKISPVSRYCSASSFGHTGFTGCMVWVDPEYQLVYIFLSNRTYPYANGNKLAEMNIRTRIQDFIYTELLKNK